MYVEKLCMDKNRQTGFQKETGFSLRLALLQKFTVEKTTDSSENRQTPSASKQNQWGEAETRNGNRSPFLECTKILGNGQGLKPSPRFPSNRIERGYFRGELLNASNISNQPAF